MPPLKPAGASARRAARTRASASAKATPRRKAAPRKPRTNSAHHKPAPRRKTARKPKPAPLPIRRPPPPRAADPSAKATGRRRSYYTAEFLAEARRRIESTLDSISAIAAELGMDKTVLGRLMQHEGWVRPPGASRLRSLSPVLRLAAEADALAQATPTPTLPLAGGGSPTEFAAPPPRDNTPLDNAAIDRIEAAVLKELGVVERMRASLGAEPSRPADAERTARTLSILTETLAKLRRLRLAAQPPSGQIHDDYPADIDDFRNEFARRLDAFVASCADAPGAAAAGPPERSDPVSA